MRIARSSTIWPQLPQSYVELSQKRNPSPSRRTLAALLTSTPQVLHRKHSICQPLVPATLISSLSSINDNWDWLPSSYISPCFKNQTFTHLSTDFLQNTKYQGTDTSPHSLYGCSISPIKTFFWVMGLYFSSFDGALAWNGHRGLLWSFD